MAVRAADPMELKVRNEANMEKTLVDIRHLNKRFEAEENTVEALSDINLQIKAGEIVSVIGSSGCGKSTLLRIIGGLEMPSSGEILFDGKAITAPSREKGFIFQDHRLLPWLTITENIRFSMPEKLDNQDELISRNIELVGLKGFENAYPKQLSGGMAQRVSIARALVNRPKILLLDEPFGALDALTKMRMQDEILSIWEKEKITMVVITHDIDEAIYLGNRVVVMTPRPGRIKLVQDIKFTSLRMRTGPAFAEYKDIIYREFFADSDMPFVYSI